MPFDKLFISTTNAQAGINPEGGYVSSWKIKNQAGEYIDILYQGASQKRTGIPVLFPYFGKAEGKRQHGFGRDFTWTVIEQQPNKIVMSLNSTEIDDAARAEYPYHCSATITVELHDDNSMIYTLHAKNTGDEPMPTSPGLHPYWAVPQDQKNQVTIEGIAGFDASQINWQTTPPDNTYDYSGKVTTHFPDKDIVIEDVSAADTKVKHIVVWSQTPEKDDYNFICVEPVCGPNNALHDSPILIAPGETWEMKLKFFAHLK